MWTRLSTSLPRLNNTIDHLKVIIRLSYNPSSTGKNARQSLPRISASCMNTRRIYRTLYNLRYTKRIPVSGREKVNNKELQYSTETPDRNNINLTSVVYYLHYLSGIYPHIVCHWLNVSADIPSSFHRVSWGNFSFQRYLFLLLSYLLRYKYMFNYKWVIKI